MSNMLDVLHYLFEEDVNFISPEQMEGKSRTRQIVYEKIYERVFEYGMTPSPDYYDSPNEFGDAGAYVEKKPYTNSEVKPYIPATNFDPSAPNPFQGVLRESPLG